MCMCSKKKTAEAFEQKEIENLWLKPTKEIKALIFDMDGVIVDSEPIHEWAEAQVFREFGLDVPRREWDNFRGKKIEDIFAYARIIYGAGNEPLEKMIARKIEVYLARALESMQLILGAREFFAEQRIRQQYRLALTTSGRKVQQEKILDKFDLAGFFEIIVTADDVNQGKPHPEPYLITVEKLAEHPSQCLVIEDSDNGILSAKAAGCQVCGITTTFSSVRLETAGADVVVSGYDELARMLFR